MANFINPDFPARHLGVERAMLAMANLRKLQAAFKGAKGLVAMLAAGGISALIVVADQIVSTWTDGHLMVAWIALWAAMFAALALFAEASRGWSAKLGATLARRSEAAAQHGADERMWALAQSDPRFMADIQAARWRSEREALENGEPLPHWPFATSRTHP